MPFLLALMHLSMPFIVHSDQPHSDSAGALTKAFQGLSLVKPIISNLTY